MRVYLAMKFVTMRKRRVLTIHQQRTDLRRYVAAEIRIKRWQPLHSSWYEYILYQCDDKGVCSRLPCCTSRGQPLGEQKSHGERNHGVLCCLHGLATVLVYKATPLCLWTRSGWWRRKGEQPNNCRISDPPSKDRMKQGLFYVEVYTRISNERSFLYWWTDTTQSCSGWIVYTKWVPRYIHAYMQPRSSEAGSTTVVHYQTPPRMS